VSFSPASCRQGFGAQRIPAKSSASADALPA
jgi:hypothetical protein